MFLLFFPLLLFSFLLNVLLTLLFPLNPYLLFHLSLFLVLSTSLAGNFVSAIIMTNTDSSYMHAIYLAMKFDG
jgi:hypothetical protein